MSTPGQRVGLDALGPRICIMEPSSSGRSTLATAIRRARRLACVHRDAVRRDRPAEDQAHDGRRSLSLP
ncbi:hypothetical protein FE263_04335 [Lichenicoccus roseus]|uniref:Uncharacterized protein n=1 Tax=Lichenicoccus roseus TaxID=2683649 RepID=A0A5R9JBQ0_9PROT|nr:hypothetical protein FE263_04335 [Lichenicoccus roseus]